MKANYRLAEGDATPFRLYALAGMRRHSWIILSALAPTLWGARFVRADSVAKVLPSTSAVIAAATEKPKSTIEQAATEVKEAQANIDSIESPAEKATLYASMALVYARLGDLQNYDRAISQAQQLNPTTPDTDQPPLNLDQTRRDALPYLARAKARSKDLAGAMALVKQYESSPALWQMGISAAAVGQAESGDMEGSARTVELLPEGVRDETRVKIAAAMAEQGKLDEARSVARSIADHKWQGDAYVAIVAARTSVSDDRGAMAMADLIGDGHYKDKAYRLIAIARARDGDSAGAKNIALMIADESIASQAFLSLGQYQLRRGNFPAANDLVEHTHGHDYQQFLREFVTAYANLGNIPLAKETLSRITDRFERLLAYRSIAFAMVKQNDILGARVFLNPLPSDQRPVLLMQLARLAAEGGQGEIALRILKEIDKREEVPGMKLVSPLIHFRAGDRPGYDDAIEALQTTADTSSSKDERERASAFLFAIKALTGDTEGARAAAQGVPAEKLIYIAGSSTARLDVGDTAGPLTMAAALPYASEQVPAYQHIAEAMMQQSTTPITDVWIKALATPKDRTAAYIGTAMALLDASSHKT